VSTAAEAFREIDTQVAEARRALDYGAHRHVVRQHLVAIETLAQNGLREARGDTEQQVMDYAAGHLDRLSRGLHTGEPT
jgi:hypothetical protein